VPERSRRPVPERSRWAIAHRAVGAHIEVAVRHGEPGQSAFLGSLRMSPEEWFEFEKIIEMGVSVLIPQGIRCDFLNIVEILARAEEVMTDG
jgi:hypothetical protein